MDYADLGAAERETIANALEASRHGGGTVNTAVFARELKKRGWKFSGASALDAVETSPRKFGDLPAEEQRAVAERAMRKVGAELAANADAISAIMDEAEGEES